ncbi:MAG: DMT family transporter [Merdibacter sp.]
MKKGVFYLLVTSFLFSSQQALGKVLYYLSTFERTFYFSLVAAIIMGLLCKWKKQPLIAGNLKLIGMRSLFGYISTVLLFLAATQTYPVANISLLSSTSTIFALLAAVIWLKEHMARGQVLSVLIAFAGIVLILRPTGGFIEAESLAGLGAGFFAGLAYTVVRKLKDESPFTITFCFMSFSVIVIAFRAHAGIQPAWLKRDRGAYPDRRRLRSSSVFSFSGVQLCAIDQDLCLSVLAELVCLYPWHLVLS